MPQRKVIPFPINGGAEQMVSAVRRVVAYAPTMPKQSSNDELVRRQRELRATRIKNTSRIAADRVVKMFEGKKKPTAEEIALAIETEFLKLPL